MTTSNRVPSAPQSTPISAVGFTIGILILVAALLSWYAHTRIDDFSANQQRVMQANVEATATEVSHSIRNLRRNVSLFAQDRAALISHLAKHPDDIPAYRRLQAAIATHFPKYFAFTVAGSDGAPLLLGMDKLVGKGCQRDIRTFAKQLDAHRLYIHSSPEQHPHHFDIMVPWMASDEQAGQAGVFFVSFFVDDIARILAVSQSPGSELVIVREDKQDAIELTADGARDEIPRPRKLSTTEQQHVGASIMIDETRWHLLVLQEPEKLSDYRSQVRNEALFVFLLFTWITLVLLYFIHHSERALRRSNAQLASSLQTLRDTQQHLVESEKLAALGGLVAGVAHEINTPVGIAITAVSHLQEEQQQTAARLQHGELKKSQLQSFINTAAESTRITLSNLQRAAELVRSFKLVSSDQTHQERRRFELCGYLNEVLVSLRPKLKHSKVVLKLDCVGDIDMHSYPGALAQILTNLLDNALIHAFEKGATGQLTLSVSQQHDQVTLRFADDGKGMDSETLARVFEPFFTRNRDQGGTGLGLHIVYNLVSAKLHGRISCESTPGQGTRFVLNLPRVTPEPNSTE